MFPLHQDLSQQAPGHRPNTLPNTLVGYVALQREADLARAAARPTPSPAFPASVSPTLRALVPDVGTRLRQLLSRGPVTRPSELACCA